MGKMKNPAVPKAFGTGYLNVRNCSLSYSLVNPAVRLRRTGNALAIRFKKREDSVLPLLSAFADRFDTDRTTGDRTIVGNTCEVIYICQREVDGDIGHTRFGITGNMRFYHY